MTHEEAIKRSIAKVSAPPDVTNMTDEEIREAFTNTLEIAAREYVRLMNPFIPDEAK